MDKRKMGGSKAVRDQHGIEATGIPSFAFCGPPLGPDYNFVAVRHVVHVYAHPGRGSTETLRRAIKDANGLQTQYKFEFVEPVNGLTGSRGLLDVCKLEG